jgi:hypothetical protein
MSTVTPQQLIAAQQANLDTFFGVANKAFAGFEKLVALNLQVSKAALAESQDLVTKARIASKPFPACCGKSDCLRPQRSRNRVRRSARDFGCCDGAGRAIAARYPRVRRKPQEERAGWKRISYRRVEFGFLCGKRDLRIGEQGCKAVCCDSLDGLIRLRSSVTLVA